MLVAVVLIFSARTSDASPQCKTVLTLAAFPPQWRRHFKRPGTSTLRQFALHLCKVRTTTPAAAGPDSFMHLTATVVTSVNGHFWKSDLFFFFFLCTFLFGIVNAKMSVNCNKTWINCQGLKHQEELSHSVDSGGDALFWPPGGALLLLSPLCFGVWGFHFLKVQSWQCC